MSEIEQFYADKSIFLTGGTGFLGKILIEKLLRSCSRLKRIYVLIRPNSANNPSQRLNELFSCEVFKNIRENQPHLMKKVEPISGNITYPNLGISYDCLQRLKREVDVVLHSAATIRFDEPLKKALEINLCGTEAVIKFCNQLDNLIVSSFSSSSHAPLKFSATVCLLPSAASPNFFCPARVSTPVS